MYVKNLEPRFEQKKEKIFKQLTPAGFLSILHDSRLSLQPHI